MDIRWAPSKSAQLKRSRSVSFEEIIQAEFIAAKEHHSRKNQSILLFRLADYIWVVPYVMRDDEIFLKTLFPSRKYTRMWRNGEFL